LNDQRAAISCLSRTCPNCCRIVRVPVTHCDLARLSQVTLRSTASFGEWLAPHEIDMTGEPESFVELASGRRLLVLRHDAQGCHLLTSDGQCSEYGARPAACAAYPYALSELSVRHQPRRLFVLPDSPCGANLTELASLEAHAAVEQVELELNAYVRLVAQWNRRQKRRRFAGHRPKDAASFLAFLATAEG
jgi:Fe-S-cluster containining protein